MGLPDSYIPPEKRSAALRLTGDGVVVPVMRWLAERVLEPLAVASARSEAA
jgi:DNA (cytosine-5)-methyltransferase 1